MENEKIQSEKKDVAYYDFYDYDTFWTDRQYEHKSEVITISNFLKKITVRGAIADVGGGLGRLAPYYAPKYKEATLLDPSGVQLNRTKERIGSEYPNLKFVQGVAEQMPFKDNSLDTIICVRISHHIPNFSQPILEFKRTLLPGGYLILEIANKLHVKAQFRALKSRKLKELNSPEYVSTGVKDKINNIAFGNHNPKTIKQDLEKSGFEIISVRSVSNFRSAFIKKVFPLPVVLFFERTLQAFLGKMLFGPSIFFLARKKSFIN